MARKQILISFIKCAALAFALTLCLPAQAQILRKDSTAVARRDSLERILVRVGNDTVPAVMHDRNYGRYDRGLFNWLFFPKGKWAFGLTANYGQISTDNLQLLDVITDIDLKGKIYSLNPSVSYFFGHNSSIGLKVSYSRGEADLNSFNVDIDDDMNFNLHDISYINQTFAMGPSYRYYVGLDRGGRFGVFNEVDLMFQTGYSKFRRPINDKIRETNTTITQASLNFNPGVVVFIQQNVAFNVSFGVFGLKVRSEKQLTDDVYEGSRLTSGANFRFNIFNLAFGMLIVL